MTVNELLTLIDSLYPNGETNATKVMYMNIALHTMAPYFGDVYEDVTLVTVADQDAYDLPAVIEDITQIISVAVAYRTTPESRYDYKQYKRSKTEYHPMSYYSYYGITSGTNKQIILYPAPLEDDLPIVIRYKHKLQDLSADAVTQEPDFDERYHEALAFYAVHMICASGASPDSTQANIYMQKFDSMLQSLWKYNMEKEKKLNKKPRDNPQWHRNRSYAKLDLTSPE